MDNDIILRVENLSIALDKTEILKNISFEVRAGEALAIIGPNGAGKTVLFRALLGLIPYQGQIIWQKGTTIGYVPQKFHADPSMPLTALEFLLLQSKHFWLPKTEYLAHLNHELALVGLPESILHNPITALSGGQLQRLLISWAMLNHPRVLLFDEPTAGIDVGSEETIYTIMQRLQKERGTTVLLISHDLNIIYRYAQTVLCLNKEMKCHGAPTEVLNPQELAQLYGGGKFYQHAER